MNCYTDSIVYLLILLLLGCICIYPDSVQAREKNGVVSLPAPNWVHPARRAGYPGYEKQSEQKQSATIWQYSTNRPQGNIRGGGTTRVEDYRPFHEPEKKTTR